MGLARINFIEQNQCTNHWTILPVCTSNVSMAGLKKFLVKYAKLQWTIWNIEVSYLTRLGPVLDPIVRRRSSLFGHVARLKRGHTCPPNLVVPHRSVTRSPSRSELEAMSCPPSEQVAWPTPRHRDNGTPPADLWRRAVMRGHSGVS